MLKRPQIIHIQWLLHPQEDYYFIRLLSLLRFRIVYTAHNLLPHDGELMNDKQTFLKIYKVVDKIIVHTENNKREIIHQFNLDANKIDVIPHGVYDIFFSKKTFSKEESRKELAIPTGKKVVLFFGLLRRYKGLEYLVDSFKQVKVKVNDALLLIVGKAGGEDVERTYYSDYIRNLKGNNDITCVDEYIPFEKVAYYFSASDLVVLPYLKTYQSGILLLAYAAGRPVVVTDTGGLAETVEDGKSGYVVPTADVDALGQAIIRVLENSTQMEEMGRYGKYLADTKYSWDYIASKTRDVYHKL